MKWLGESAGRLRSKGKSRKGLSAKARDESPSDSLRALSRHLAKIPHSGGRGKAPPSPALPAPSSPARRGPAAPGAPSPFSRRPRPAQRAPRRPSPLSRQAEGTPPRRAHRARCCGARRRPTSTCPRRSRQAARTGSGRLDRGLLAACGAAGPRSERSAPPAALRGLKAGEKARRAKETPPRCAVKGKFVRGAGSVRTKCMLPRRRGALDGPLEGPLGKSITLGCS